MSQVLLMNDVYTNKMNSHKEGKTRSTFRIPVQLMPFFKLKIDEYKTVDKYFRFLLKRFRLFNFSGMIPKADKIKTLYQNKGLGYERVDFEPRNEDWIELGTLALAFGKSRCWLFTFLFQLDLFGFGKFVDHAGDGVPSLSGCYLFTGIFSRRRTGHFTRAMKLRPDYFGGGFPITRGLYGLMLPEAQYKVLKNEF